MQRVIYTPAGAAGGRATGAMFLGGFGALWLWVGAVNAGRGTLATALVIGVATLACFYAAYALQKAASRLPPPPEQKGVGRAFLWINVAQYVVAGAAIFFLVNTGHTDWAPAALAVVVGLHFYPLGWLFRSPIQYATGTAMIVAALSFGSHFVGVMLAAGAILWVTAAYQLVSGYRLVSGAGAVSAA